MTRAGRTGRVTSPPLPRAEAGWAYFFDIDGTLVDIAAAPGRVRLDRELRDVLAALHRATGGAVALISGRAIVDIDKLFPGARFPAAGQYGTERRDAAGHLTRHAVRAHRLDAVRRHLAEVVARHRGLLLEDKGLSLALHYRRAPRFGPFAARLLRMLQAQLGADYCVQTGKRVIELKPAGRDKGMAVVEFLAEDPFRGRIPVFVGDDASDEYGFATVNRLGGVSVKVGPGPTVARWRLHGVRSVRAWLARGNGDRPGP